MAELRDALQPVLPDDAAQAALAGRVWRPDVGGPSVVAVRDGALVDVSATFPTMRDLCEADAPADICAPHRRAYRQAGRCWPIRRPTGETATSRGC